MIIASVGIPEKKKTRKNYGPVSDGKYGVDWKDKEKVYTQRNYSSSEGVDVVRKETGPIPTQLLQPEKHSPC